MLFIAKRLFRGEHKGQVSSSAIRIATAGVAVGILVMIVSICVSSGFQREIKAKVAALVGHVQIVNEQTLYRSRTMPIQITDSIRDKIATFPYVESVQRFALCPGMLKTENVSRGVMFRGVDDAFDASFLSSCLIEGRIPAFGEMGDEVVMDSILVSAPLASALELCAGQRIYAYFFDDNLRVRRLTVAGIFQTHLSDIDTRMCYADARLTQKLAGFRADQYSGAEIRVDEYSHVDSLSVCLASMFGTHEDAYRQCYATPRVDELYPHFFSWLTLLDTNVGAILILMICVAIVTMVSGLLVIILERTQFIGIMKSMGATNSLLRRIFLYFASMIVLRGMLWGNALAFMLLTLQYATGIVSLDPESYYIAQVPVYFPWLSIIVVNVLTFVLCVLVLIVPTYVISRIHPARSIVFE